MGGLTPANSVVDALGAVCTRVLRSVKVIGDDIPAGITWQTKDPRKEYNFGPELGHGNYGVVHAVTHIQSGRIYACKILRKQLSSVQRKYLLTEVSALKRVSDHPNVATLHEVWEDSGYIYLIMEACLGGELFDVIIQRGHFTERDAAVVMKVILEVVQHCHKNGVAHRDLKPENFLLKRKSVDPSIALRAEDLRAVDFGLAVFLEPEETLKELLGSPFYVAPELLRGSYGYPADVWSAGVILYILLSGSPPFSGNNEREVFRRVLKQPLDLTSKPWPQVSDSAKDLVSKLLDRDVAKRLTPQQALRHSWLRTAAGEANVLQSNLVMERLRRFTDMTKLQGMLMNLIAKNLSTEGIDSLRDAFNSLDQNGDGYLSFEELRQGLDEASAGSGECSSLAKAVMDALDVSGDGSIEYHEFLAAVVDRQRMLTDHTLAEMFAYVDKNKDGLISAQELSDALAESGITVSQATLKQLMSKETPSQQPDQEPMLTEINFAEVLRRGLQSETIHLSQLEEALTEMQYSFRMRNRFRQLAMLVIARTTPVSELQGLRELFERLDVDNSGWLSLEELRRGLEAIDSELGDEDIEELLDFMDVDGSGTIDYHEFVMGVLEDKQLLTEAKLQAAFDYFDLDHNGKIDIGEVEKVVKDLGIKMKQSPRELVALADSNKDQVVDFTEFREMMLAAEPNILINRQQSLVPRSSGASAATLSPRSSSRSSQDCVNQALVQPLSLRADLHQGSAELAARRAALPEGAVSNAAREDLSGASPAAAAVAEQLPSPAEEVPTISSRESSLKASLQRLSLERSMADRLSIQFPRRSGSMRIHNPFTDFREAQWTGSARGSSDGGGGSMRSLEGGSPWHGRNSDQGLAPEERQASSLPHDSVTRDDLRQLVRQRSRSVSWSDQADARERVLEGRAPRRRRHLVYLGGGTGPTLDSIKPGEMDSVDEIIRRASIANSEELDMASGQSSAASSSNPNRAQALSRGILMPCSWQLPPPSVFNDTAPETPHNLSTTVGNVQATILEHEVLLTSSQGGLAAPEQPRTSPAQGRAASVESTCMLSYMEDQWWKTSLLARSKGRPRG